VSKKNHKNLISHLEMTKFDFIKKYSTDETENLTEKAFLLNFFCIKKVVKAPCLFLAEISYKVENFGSLRGF